jgi:hypothetical protein
LVRSPVTGATVIAGQLGAKRIELLREVMPKVAVIPMLVNPNNVNAAPDISDVLNASSEQEIDAVFESVAQSKGPAAPAYLSGDHGGQERAGDRRRQSRSDERIAGPGCAQ